MFGRADHGEADLRADMTDEEFRAMPLMASRPRRKAHLFAYTLSVGAGLFFMFFPPNTTIQLLETSVPARMWGVFFFVGGLVSMYAWFRKILIVKRIGLSLIIIGLGALIINQTILFFDGPTYTRGGGTVVLLVALALLVARWQDVHHDEILAQDLLDYETK